MAEYIPSPRDRVREQVALYEGSGGTKGTTLRDTGLPVVIVTNTGNKTGAIRKTPLMRVKDAANYVLVGSQGGAPTSSFATLPWCSRCGCARSRTMRSGIGSGTLPSRRFRPTPNTRRGPPGRSPSCPRGTA